VKAFRDTWRDGIHSYLTYLRDRLTIARDLLTESGSIFVQIGDENVHRVRALMDDVFGDENHIARIAFTGSLLSAADRPTVGPPESLGPLKVAGPGCYRLLRGRPTRPVTGVNKLLVDPSG